MASVNESLSPSKCVPSSLPPRRRPLQQSVPRRRSLRIFKMVLPVLISMVMRSFIVSGQNCFGGIETFEKVAMTQVAPHISPAGVLLHQQDQALTRDCVNLCKQHPLCLSFGLDYVGFKCDAYEVNSQSSQQLADLVVSNNSNYFEKVCYRGVSRDDYERMCGHERLWTFERVRGAILEGFERLQLNYIQSRSECAKACLMEATFTCRSADYDDITKMCRLSQENRRTQPQAFRLVPDSNREYLENQCVSSGTKLCLFETKKGATVATMDSLVYAHDTEECQMKCNKETTFQCRSYSLVNNQCFLSGDDTIALAHSPLPAKEGSTYGEKKCISEQCYQNQIMFISHERAVSNTLGRSGISLPDSDPVTSTSSPSPGPTTEGALYRTNFPPVSTTARTLTTLSTGRLALQHGPQAVSGPDKPTWEQASVSCTKAEMVLTINFDSAFRGRVYAKGSPDHCYVLGAGQTQLQFAIPLDPRCGTRAEGPNAYANDVVIQQHAAIMRDSDLHIRVLCSFETIDQTVTASDPAPVGHRKSHLFSDHAEKWRDNIARSRVYVPSSEPIANPTTVSSTAPQPAIVMRVIGPAGSKDSQVVGLGDMLTLIIELHDPNLTPMGIFARNVYAKSASGESWLLIDTHGCPTDASVFPAMKPVGNGNKALISTFKAFKFPSTGTVNFEAQVRFCMEKCEPIVCPPGGHSSAQSSGQAVDPQPTGRASGQASGQDLSRSRRHWQINTLLTDMKRDFVFTESLPSGEVGTKETTPATIKSHMLTNEMQEVVVETTPHSEALTANDTKKFARSASHATDHNNMSTPTAAHFMASFESTNGSSDTSVSYRQMSPYPANTYQQGYHQPTYNQPPNQYGSQPPGYGQGYYPGAYTPTFGGPNYGPPGYTPNYQHPNSWASRTSPDVPTKVNFTYGGTSWTSPGQDQNRYGNDPMRASGQGTHGVRELPPPTVLSAPSPAGQPSNPFSAGPPGSNPQVVTGQLGGPSPGGNNQAASPMFTVQSSRPLPAKEKGKFKPPRPLPRPKGANPGTLHTSITVKEKDGDEQEQSGNWNIERRARNPSKQELNGCNTGPAILYTAIVVTLLHCTILMGGYLYYRRFIGYPKSSSASAKLLRPQSFTNDESHVVGSMGHHHGGHTMTRNGPPFQSDPRNIRSNVPQGSTTSTNNSNVFYGQGTFRESPRDHPGNNFRSLYTGHFGSPP